MKITYVLFEKNLTLFYLVMGIAYAQALILYNTQLRYKYLYDNHLCYTRLIKLFN